MKALVTGCAGFIGSNLTKRLVTDGWSVVGIDALTDYYPRDSKLRNIKEIDALSDGLDFVEGRLEDIDLDSRMNDVDVVFHQAAQPGVRGSWSEFGEYVRCNITATYAVLEACRRAPNLSRLVYASSSSVYGDAETYPTSESAATKPRSPYGVTKLAAEHLVRTYAAGWGLPGVSLRYFTVYGPRQRPDMATRRLLEHARLGTRFPLYGDGTQVRDFTYVDDIVEANVLAGTSRVEPGEVLNVSGGGQVTMNELIDVVMQTTGKQLKIDRRPDARGDVTRTGGDCTRAKRILGWSPQVGLRDGVSWMYEWLELNG